MKNVIQPGCSRQQSAAMRLPASKCFPAPATNHLLLIALIVFVSVCCLIDTCNSQDLDIETEEELLRKVPNRRKGSSPSKCIKTGEKITNSSNNVNDTEAAQTIVPTKVVKSKPAKPSKRPGAPSKVINKRHQVKPLTINDANRFLNNALPKKRVDRCPLCDSSVYSYCSDKLLHDACCCLSPYGKC
ncbi:uncharacterized protein LOC111055901 isoform X2 [Nilaparvata lugens]|uniref:uncharacterized protein LOC111055901 isoform X2 n=1 Tax=Nilaparvata lugens TaxID=108931 RepID=UPI00193E4C86|nr:uncharacterized protein LOC111055901 isoform X2 [Nilaparvata lugens]